MERRTITERHVLLQTSSRKFFANKENDIHEVRERMYDVGGTIAMKRKYGYVSSSHCALIGLFLIISNTHRLNYLLTHCSLSYF
jgi:hypothetical protein